MVNPDGWNSATPLARKLGIKEESTFLVRWPKKASGVRSDLQSRDVMMEFVFPLGLVDVRIAAIPDIWSGYKPVVRKELSLAVAG